MDTPITESFRDCYDGTFLPAMERLERENTALSETCEKHRAYARMMQQQRSQIAAYCRTLEKQVEALNPANLAPEVVGAGGWADR